MHTDRPDVEVRVSAIEGLDGRPPLAKILLVTIVHEVTEAAPLREEVGEPIERCSYPRGKLAYSGAFPTATRTIAA